jgi:flagellar biosynthetic protein FlhB
MSGGQDKTEKATPKRLKELRKKGSLQHSQDLSAWLGIGAGALMLPAVLTSGTAAAREQLANITTAAAAPDAEEAVTMLGDALWSAITTLTPLLGVVVLTAILGSASQGSLRPSFQRLKPKFEQFNVAKGLKRMFGAQAAWQGVKAALKALAIGAVLWSVIQGMVPLMLGSGNHSLSQVIDVASGGATDLVKAAVIAGLLLAAADVVVVVRRNRKQSRMTKREVFDEHKMSEGDPQLKGAIRSRQLAMSRNRMISDVANADVVLVNPTHVAVALRYEPGKGAPRVVAKGAGHMAARIREAATKARVPMVEDIPLARALHAACDLDQEVPQHLYVAVAQVLAFVMALRRRGAAVGMHRAPGGPTRLEEAA